MPQPGLFARPLRPTVSWLASCNLRWCLSAAFLGAVSIAIVAGSASAHEHQHAGDYEFVVGWSQEPPLVGVLNGFSLRINLEDAGGNLTPVSGAESAISARITMGTASSVRALEPEFGALGRYTFDILPSREGVYTVVLTGNLNGTAVNLSFELDEVKSRLDVEFPVVDPSPSELAQNNSEQQVLIAQLQEDNRQLRSQMGSTNGMAIAALALAVVGLVAVGAASKRGRPKA